MIIHLLTEPAVITFVLTMLLASTTSTTVVARADQTWSTVSSRSITDYRYPSPLQYSSIVHFAKCTLDLFTKPVAGDRLLLFPPWDHDRSVSPFLQYIQLRVSFRRCSTWGFLTIFIAVSALFFSIVFESWVVTIFTSTEIIGYRITTFKQVGV